MGGSAVEQAQCYEVQPGAASAPLRSGYKRREPENTVLHEVVRETLETFLAQAREDGHGLPRHVENELRRYLSCGQLSEALSTHVHENDRPALEHLLRYALRPPLALSRLSRSSDGRVLLRLKRPMHDGTREVAFTPLRLLRRLAALVPPPRWQQTRYFGVFAPGTILTASAKPVLPLDFSVAADGLNAVCQAGGPLVALAGSDELGLYGDLKVADRTRMTR